MTPADPCPHVPVHLFCSCTLLRGGPHLLRSVGDRSWGGGPWSQARHFVAPSRAETPRLACGSLRILRWGEVGTGARPARPFQSGRCALILSQVGPSPVSGTASTYWLSASRHKPTGSESPHFHTNARLPQGRPSPRSAFSPYSSH